MTKRLEGKVALVTGASKGIGAGIAARLAAEGAAVAVNYSASKEAAERVVAAITGKGGKAVAVHGNLTAAGHLKKVVAETVKAFGAIDILVNNAGLYEFAPLDGITAEHFHKHFDLNVLGLLLVSQEAARHFSPAGGSIINISSGVSTIAPPNGCGHCGMGHFEYHWHVGRSLPRHGRQRVEAGFPRLRPAIGGGEAERGALARG